MGFLSDLISNPVGAISGSTSAKRQVNRGTAAANAQLQVGLDQAKQALMPYVSAGNAPLQSLLSGTAQGGQFNAGGPAPALDPNAFAFNPTGLPAIGDPNINPALPNTGFNAPVDPFSSSNFNLQTDPSYNFRLQQSLDSLSRGQAAGGRFLSGETGKGLVDYAGGAASQEYSNAYNRALGENQLAYDRALGENQLAYNRNLDQSNTLYSRGADTYNRNVSLNDLLYGRQLGQNQQDYTRGLLANETNYTRDLQAQGDLYTRLRDLAGLGFNASSNLADANLRASGAAAGNLATAGQTNAAVVANVQSPFQQQLFQSLVDAATKKSPPTTGGG